MLSLATHSDVRRQDAAGRQPIQEGTALWAGEHRRLPLPLSLPTPTAHVSSCLSRWSHDQGNPAVAADAAFENQ